MRAKARKIKTILSLERPSKDTSFSCFCTYPTITFLRINQLIFYVWRLNLANHFVYRSFVVSGI